MKEFASTKKTAEHKPAKLFAPERIEESAPVYAAAAFGLPIQRKASCACGGGCSSCQARSSDLKVSQPNDPAEIEADQIAETVMRMPDTGSVQPNPHSEGIAPMIQTKSSEGSASVAGGISNRIHSSRGGGSGMDGDTRGFMESRFGTDLSHVRIHTGSEAASLNRELSARAFTIGSDIFFDEGQYQPRSDDGKRLLAHELAHVGQQGKYLFTQIQRAALTSPRFTRMPDLQAALDNVDALESGDSGRGVQAIQQALYDLGYPLPTSGADGDYGPETVTAVSAFQAANPPLTVDGRVGPATMAALDSRFPTPVLPPPVDRAAPWTPACVLSILCPWSPHTVDVLRTRITLIAYDHIHWDDERWNGASWVVDPFPGAGYNTGTEIGVLNSSCESMAETLYHEVLHAEQPSSHTTTRENENYAYRIGEEFSIAMGLGGDPSLRSTDAQGRQFADRGAVETLVSSTYPGVSAGAPGDQIIGKAAAAGHVQVQRPDTTIYTRPAAVGESVPGPEVRTPDPGVTHSTAGWNCP